MPLVAGVEKLLSASSRHTRLLTRIAINLVEWAHPPRRLSKRALGDATVALRALACSRSQLRRDLLAMLKTFVTLAYASDPRVLDVVGVQLTCREDPARARAGSDPRPERLRPESLLAPSGAETCDVVVVGSGAGGAAAARTLAELGLDVLVLEQGHYHDAREYPSDPITALSMLYREGGLTYCEGRPRIPMPVGRAVGGTTVINSGTCLRASDAVLQRWASEFAIEWATELAADYEELERALAVEPVDPRTAGRNAALCKLGADRLGYSNRALPRNAGAVSDCSTCPTGCALDAKRAAHVSELPRAAAAGARIRAGKRVEAIAIRGGRAVGVRADGYEVQARAVVLAAGALGTPELLLGQGLANRSGAVGQHLRIHPASWVGALFQEPVRGWEGVMQSWVVDQFSDQGLFLEATSTPLAFGAQALPGVGEELQGRIGDYGRLGVIGVHLSESSEGRVERRRGRTRISYSLRQSDAELIRFGIARAAEIHFAAGAVEVYPQLGREMKLTREELTRIEQRRVRRSGLRLEAFHPMGTARMGADPKRTVVAPSGETHGVPGLYVADASIFPTSLGVNPMLTIMAAARQIAAGLASRLS